MLEYKLGKNGLMLQAFANGWDRAPVMHSTAEDAIKSVGNSTTTPYDIATLEQARCVYYMLAESVAARMRENGFRSKCISISIRTTNLLTHSCQRTISTPTNITNEIASIACQLFSERYQRYFPLRSIGISCSALSGAMAPVQLDMFGDLAKREKLEAVDGAIDGIRRRFGFQSIQRGIVLAEPAIAQINPKEEHTIHLDDDLLTKEVLDLKLELARSDMQALIPDLSGIRAQLDDIEERLSAIEDADTSVN